MILMSEAQTVLERAKQEMIREITQCGSAGGIGRSVSYAQQLVTIQQALDILEVEEGSTELSFADKMKAAKAAKKAVQ